MIYADFDKFLDFYNYNLSRKEFVFFDFDVIPTTFEYGFLLIAKSNYMINKKDDEETKTNKKLLWKYIRNWNCVPDENTYTEKTKKDIFFERMLDKKFRLPENEEKLEVLSSVSGDVYIGDEKFERGVRHVSALKYIKGKVAHQLSEKKIESTDECDSIDWMKDDKSLVYDSKRPMQGTDIRIYLSDEVLEKLEEEFTATLFSVRMNGSLPKNESFVAKIIYYVKEETPHLDLVITKINKCCEKVCVNGCEIDAEVCRAIEEKFRNAHIVVNKKKVDSGEVYWKTPFDWYDVPKKVSSYDVYDEKSIMALKNTEAFKEKFAVYMWVGHKKGKPNQQYLYIGIVGTRGNKDNSVGKRVLDQERKTGIAAKNNVIIDKIRFSAIEEIGDNVSMDEVLQTVEMQCINNISSLFGYISTSKPPKKIINNLFEGVYLGKEISSFRLLNDKKRYHN